MSHPEDRSHTLIHLTNRYAKRSVTCRPIRDGAANNTANPLYYHQIAPSSPHRILDLAIAEAMHLVRIGPRRAQNSPPRPAPKAEHHYRPMTARSGFPQAEVESGHLKCRRRHW